MHPTERRAAECTVHNDTHVTNGLGRTLKPRAKSPGQVHRAPRALSVTYEFRGDQFHMFTASLQR